LLAKVAAIEDATGQLFRLEAFSGERLLDAARERRTRGHTHLVTVWHNLALREELLEVTAAEFLGAALLIEDLLGVLELES